MPELLKSRSVSRQQLWQVFPHLKSVWRLSQTHSFTHSVIYSFIQSAELELIRHHACCQALGMWRWGSPWSQGPLCSLHSSTVGSPPGSERSPSRVLQDPSVPQSLQCGQGSQDCVRLLRPREWGKIVLSIPMLGQAGQIAPCPSLLPVSPSCSSLPSNLLFQGRPPASP